MRPYRYAFLLKRFLQVFVAGTLLLLFLSTPLVEAFHHHPRHHINKLVGNSKRVDQPQFQVYNFCKICDYLKHSGHHQVTPQLHCYTIYLPVVILKYKSVQPPIVPALILNAANKGPPIVG